MPRATKGARVRPGDRAKVLFGKMDAAQQRGDFICAGEAQRALERLGWTIRRRARRHRAEAREVVVPPVEADAGDVAVAGPELDGDENVEADQDEGTTPAGGVLSLVDLGWLLGVTVEEVEMSLSLGRFPSPDGYVSGKPYWEVARIDRWSTRGGRL